MKRFMLSAALAGALIISSTANHNAEASDTTVGTIIGAVGGGLLGSTLGQGKGRVVATAAGTVIGAVLGHEISSNQYPDDRDEPRRVIYRERETVYRTAPPPTRVVYRVEEEPRHKKNKKWKRAATYGDDVIVCNKNSKRCHWYD